MRSPSPPSAWAIGAPVGASDSIGKEPGTAELVRVGMFGLAGARRVPLMRPQFTLPGARSLMRNAALPRPATALPIPPTSVASALSSSSEAFP